MSLIDAAVNDPAVRPAVTARASVVACLLGDQEGFRTRPVASLDLDHEGAAGDGHRGYLRASGSREPWYPRGTVIRSGRQLSVVGVEDLEEVAARLGLPSVDAGAIGANLVVSGLPRLSYLPAGTRLFAPGGAVIVVEAMNGPCRHAGKALAALHPGRGDVELAFVEAARRRRGFVASVERAGTVAAGEALSVRVPEQWIWPG
jgi:hypothetical protein